MPLFPKILNPTGCSAPALRDGVAPFLLRMREATAVAADMTGGADIDRNVENSLSALGEKTIKQTL